ncbi:MAG: Peptidase family protein [Bacteroidota bacterium]|nr:Peptidase family protein [Bacteroidota bacterium]
MYMRKISLFLVLACLAAGYSVNANSVSVTTAQTIAINFYKVTAHNLNQHVTIGATLKYTKKEADNTVDFYVFDITGANGFVIVSADDNSKPVIAYSTESNFGTSFQNTGIANWVNGASAQIYNGILQQVPASAEITNAWSAYSQGQRPASNKTNSVSPKLTTNWNQDPFYNDLCPYNYTDGQRTVTGCVATAMAQVMKFWSYPAQGKGSHTYTAQGYGQLYANFDTSTYRWRQMPATITSGNMSIATLMYDCGVAVEMNYGDLSQGGSGAFVLQSETWGGGPCAESAYVDNFSYDVNTLQGVRKSDYSTSNWVNLMESDLNAGRVIQYEGFDQSQGGHTWVCDGYDVNDLLHMNWGWGGVSNGYFDVSNLNTGSFNPTSGEAALIGIQPPSNVLNVTASAVDAAVCPGVSTAISINGPATATYSWTPSTGLSCTTCANPTAQPATSTIYTVTVDSAGLTGVFNLVVNVNAAVDASIITASSPSCYGSSDGSVTEIATGGLPNFTYHWSNGKSTATLNNVAGGTYLVTVTDANGCTGSASSTITQPPAINITLTPANSHCGPADAILEAGVSGGAPGYFYTWSNGASTAAASGLATGTYIVTVYDNHGCSASASQAITSTGSPVQIQFNTVTTDPTNGQNNGTASVADITGGTPPYNTIRWSNGETSNTATDLSAGTYVVTVVDQNGCQQSATITLNNVTGINSISNDMSFSVYPNPAKTEIMVQLSKFESGTTVSVKNVLGQTMISQSVTDLQSQVNLSNFSDGVYFVVVKQAEKIAVKEIVVKQ